MGYFGAYFGGGSGSSGSFPALAIATTAQSIRDRIIAVIEALSPTDVSASKFVHHTNDREADFFEWCKQHPDAAFRRFQVRDQGDDLEPEISNTDVEERLVTFRIVVAYPQNARAGSKQALSRDDAMANDRRLIEHAVGMCGRANFAPPFPDACWRRDGSRTARDARDNCDLLVIDQVMAFRMTMT